MLVVELCLCLCSQIIARSQLVTRSKLGRHKVDDITTLIFYVKNIQIHNDAIIETAVFWLYVVRCRRWLWVLPLEQGLLTLQKHWVYPQLLIGFVLLPQSSCSTIDTHNHRLHRTTYSQNTSFSIMLPQSSDALIFAYIESEWVIVVVNRVRVTRSLVLYVYFVDRCLSFCIFFWSGVVCSSSICGFWLPLWYFNFFLRHREWTLRWLKIVKKNCTLHRFNLSRWEQLK
jgi:hypothetical protein